MKVFWCSNFSKMLPRCGRAAHICGANSILQFGFPAAIAFFKTVLFAIWLFLWSKLQIRTRQRGNCSTLAGKSRGGTPFCRMWKTVFPIACWRYFDHIKMQAIWTNDRKIWSSLSYLVHTLRNAFSHRKSLSMIFLCLYNSWSYSHGFIRFFFGGTTGSCPNDRQSSLVLSPS